VICARCGSRVGEGVRVCPTCGNAMPSPTVRDADARTRWRFDLRRLGVGDLIAGVGTLLILISLYLPWYSLFNAANSMSTSATGASSAEVDTAILEFCRSNPGPCWTGSGVSTNVTLTLKPLADGAGGFRFLILCLGLGILVYLVLRTLVVQWRLPLPHWQVLTVATALLGLVVLLAFFTKPFGDVYPTVTWAFGAYWGVVAAGITIIGALLRYQQPETVIPEWSGAPRPMAPPLAPLQAAAGAVTSALASGSFCGACGAPIAASRAFCSRCGTPVR